jgi:hypothetical protein
MMMEHIVLFAIMMVVVWALSPDDDIIDIERD